MTTSTLRTYPVGGQLDPAWLASSIPWTHVRATATLARPDDGAPIVDPTNGAHEHPTTIVQTLTAAQADGQWRTAALKPTTSTGADLALVPSGLTWDITVEIKRGATWHEVITYTVAPSGDRNYSGLSELVTVDGVACIDINELIPPPASVPPSSIFEDAVLEVLTDNPSATAANLSVTRDAATVTVASSTGTDATLPAATTSLAGQLTAADKTLLDATVTKTAGIASGSSTTLVAQSGAELQGWGWPKVSTVASLPGTGVAGQIYDVGGALHYWDSAATAWVQLGAVRHYSHLKEYSGEAVNAAILRDITRGALKVGDVIQTAAYFTPSGGLRAVGGNTYRVVAAATGTEDGGLFINAGSLQLMAIFGKEIRISQFGVKSISFPSTDYSSRIQAAITAASRVSLPGTLIGGGTVIFDMWAQINSTLLVDNASVTLQGIGCYAYATSEFSSGLIWRGAAGSPMIEFRDCNMGGVRDMSLIGYSTAPPVGIRHTYGNNSPGQGQSISHERLVIGQAGGFSNASVEKGIEITGSVDLDRFFLDNIEIHAVTDVGIDIVNPQATWNSIQNVLVNNSIGALTGTGTALKTRSDCSMLNFNANAMAVIFDIGDNNVWCGFMGAENCKKLLNAPMSNYNLWVGGGYCDVNDATTNAAFVDAPTTGTTGRITFSNVDFRSTGGVWPTGVTFTVGSTASTDYGALRVIDCRNVPLSAIDVSAVTSTGRLLVEFDCAHTGARLVQVVRAGDTLETGRFDPGSIVAITGATGSIYKLAVDSSGRLTINGTVVGTQS